MFLDGIGIGEAIAIVGTVVSFLAFVYGIVHSILQARAAKAIEANSKDTQDAVQSSLTKTQIAALEEKIADLGDRLTRSEDTVHSRINRLEDKLGKFVDMIIQYFTNKD